MNIGIATQRFVTGDGQGAINYAVAKAGLERGHNLVLFASDVASNLREHPNVTWVKIHVGSWPTQLIRDQIFAWKSTRRIEQHRPSLDLLMVNGAITWSPAEVNALHFVHDSWRRSSARKRDAQSFLHQCYHALYTYVNTHWERWSLHHADHAVAVSSLVKEQIEALDLNLPIHVILNGVDPDVYSPTGTSVDRASLGCPASAPLALFAGDIRRSVKNLDTVLYALQDVPSLHLAVAGSTKGSPFPDLANKLGLENRVHFLDFRRDIPALMRTADLFVFPSRYEPFSLVVLEAMASGSPVITANTVGAATLVTDACGIVLDDPNDVNALAKSLELLATNPERCSEMGRAARRIAVNHPIAATANRYIDLFEDIKQTGRTDSKATAVAASPI